MLRISLEESFRRNGDAGAPKEVAKLRRESERFHRVMGPLPNMQMEHGTCRPRERRACTHCDAKDDLIKLLAKCTGQRHGVGWFVGRTRRQSSGHSLISRSSCVVARSQIRIVKSRRR